ncbi:MAG: bifunctional histidinol-phosphatase/imidazoleglycerol-phosphate dehydratase HisB [Flavobacteriales bacterium]|nr:bifunctional histidinol-phosphatase/imidazoleglycerol-phosphate dehydratase HisB [Flavobacteriales bacterium]
MNKPRILFIDRDGTLIKEPPITFQVDHFDQLEFLPGVIRHLGNIAQSRQYRLVMVTNQDGLGTENYPEERFWPIQRLIIRILEAEGIHFDEVHIDRSYPHENLPTRKPGTGMLTHFLNGEYDIENSFVIGDRLTDVMLAKNLGCKSIFIHNYDNPQQSEIPIDFIAFHWKEIEEYLLHPPRIASEHRKTNETEIKVEINLDGTGKSSIHTGIGFFDHMLEQIARHGKIDIMIQANGDLHIDEHHTIEDTGITLGKAFTKAMGNKMGMERYGFILPMDDCLAQVAVDFGGRPWIVWNVDFKREKIGDMPTEMIFHFFKSFSDAAACNLNIQAEGQNEHHKAESIFKAFAKACRMALNRDTKSKELPTTKGIV